MINQYLLKSVKFLRSPILVGIWISIDILYHEMAVSIFFCNKRWVFCIFRYLLSVLSFKYNILLFSFIVPDYNV